MALGWSGSNGGITVKKAQKISSKVFPIIKNKKRKKQVEI